jgi:large subunit ribosomal protein L35
LTYERRYPASLVMPKMKSHSGAKKRFSKTATGKLRGRHAFSSHILEKKPAKRKRSFRKPRPISVVDAPHVRKLLGPNGR